MKNKNLIDAATKCIKDKCDEKCPRFEEKGDCEFVLLDSIMEAIGVIPEDYIEYLQNKLKCREN